MTVARDGGQCSEVVSRDGVQRWCPEMVSRDRVKLVSTTNSSTAETTPDVAETQKIRPVGRGGTKPSIETEKTSHMMVNAGDNAWKSAWARRVT